MKWNGMEYHRQHWQMTINDFNGVYRMRACINAYASRNNGTMRNSNNIDLTMAF